MSLDQRPVESYADHLAVSTGLTNLEPQRLVTVT